jgi:probable O-glycosylation ligase (exosortase A-associated)
MAPQRQVSGFLGGQPVNSIIAGATLLGWVVSTERKSWSSDLTPWLLLIFVVWFSFNSIFATDQLRSWQYWNLIIRIFIFTFLVLFIINTKVRIHALVWALVVSVGYYGVKGGVFTLANGGSYTAIGPPDTMITDNNQLGLAVVMLLPLVVYLRAHTRMPLIQTGLAAALGFMILMVLGTKSRGAAISLAVTLGYFLLRSKNRIIYAVAAVFLVGAALSFMPASYFERLDTINNLDADGSFQGRVTAWRVAILVAIDRFPFGAGFYAPQVASIYNSYFPGERPHAAHSIYFQVLGEHGFIGLAIYILILLYAIYNTFVIMWQCRGKPELLWAYDLANMTQVCLVGFYVGGAALSLAYYDAFLLMVALMSTLRTLTAPATARRVISMEAGRIPNQPRYSRPLPAPPRARGNSASTRTP